MSTRRWADAGPGQAHVVWGGDALSTPPAGILEAMGGAAVADRTPDATGATYSLLDGAKFRLYKVLQGTTAPTGAITTAVAGLNPAIGSTGFTVDSSTIGTADRQTESRAFLLGACRSPRDPKVPLWSQYA